MAEKKIAVKIEHVSKFFKLPTEATNSLRSSLVNRFRGIKGYKKQQILKDINIDIEEGDFFGILGRNGSGKSTLLKIISQIYLPENGQVTVNGKLVSFIELGVGFNPELTGRENVYLNGALLGFSRQEMDSMYDEIVDFAELREFMNQKLKNYSSGMQVRLAFSVAIKAQGDILVLDEVLAVGDEAFQRKCDDYFLERKRTGKTTILVTHDMGAVKKYCNKAILIEDGLIKVSGVPEEVAIQYSLDNASSLYHAASRYSEEDMELFDLKEFELDVRYLNSEQVTIYYDIAGKGFSQKTIQQFPLKKSDQLSIPIPADCQRIRIDLSEQPSYFSNVVLVNPIQQVELLPSYTNGIFKDKLHLFPDPDPQLTYDLPVGLSSVDLSYTLHISKESEQALIQQSADSLKDMVQDEVVLRRELENYKRYISELETKLNSLTQQEKAEQ